MLSKLLYAFVKIDVYIWCKTLDAINYIGKRITINTKQLALWCLFLSVLVTLVMLHYIFPSKTKIGALESDIFNVLIYAYLSIESYKVIDSHTPGKEPSLELLLMRFNDFMGIIGAVILCTLLFLSVWYVEGPLAYISTVSKAILINVTFFSLQYYSLLLCDITPPKKEEKQYFTDLVYN